MSTQEQKIDDIIRPSLTSMGYDLIMVRIVGTEKRPTLQILSECLPKEGKVKPTCVSVGDCQEISKTVSMLLDVEDPLDGSYNLEVSSPGIDRPLVKLSDYIRFKGHEIKAEAPNIIDDRKRFQGDITNIDETNALITVTTDESQEFELPLSKIIKAKLVITDKLLKAFQNKEI